MMTVITIVLLVVYIYLGLKMPAIALVTSPFVAGALLVMGAADEDPAVMIMAPLLFLGTLLAVTASKRDPDSEQWPQICAKWIVVILVLLLATITAGIAFGPLGVTGFVLFIVFLGSIVTYYLTSRHATAAFVISTIGSSMRQNLPLPMALESAAGGSTDNRSRILRGIKQWLVQGYPLSESIRRGYPKCPGHAIGMIAAAERIGQLPYAFKAIEADMIAKANDRRRLRPVHPFYPVILMVFTFLILSGFMLFVVPQFRESLIEMTGGGALPPATRIVLDISGFFLFKGGWLIGLLIALIILIVALASLYAKFRPRQPGKPYLISRIGDFLKWHLPILHRFEKDYSMVQVVELLRLSLIAGCPVNDAIDSTLGLDVNNGFRKRLRKWLKKVERGDNIAEAARQSRLGSPLAWAFDDKVNQGNTLSILEMLESFYRSNYSYYVNLARIIMWPCITLSVGAFIGFIVYAIFMPGIQIINTLAGMVHP
ncbi:MAG: type II secretion system F family protein [Sedimentisphaerales bacterium]|nr:type II secretion system F family protein [Sedimentisphaerales bacterium]